MSRDLAASSCHGQAPWPARVLRVTFAAVPMCGRTALSTKPEDLREIFGLDEVPQLVPHYNVPPSRPVAAVRVLRSARGRKMELLRWGLVPSWADDPKVGHRLSLARIETAASTPAFRDAIRRRRCLVVVDGFYEWKREGKKSSHPFFVRRAGRRPLRARRRLGPLGVEGRRGRRVVRHRHPAVAAPGRGGARPDAPRARASGVGELARSAAPGRVGAARATLSRARGRPGEHARQRPAPRRPFLHDAAGPRSRRSNPLSLAEPVPRPCRRVEALPRDDGGRRRCPRDPRRSHGAAGAPARPARYRTHASSSSVIDARRSIAERRERGSEARIRRPRARR